MSVCVHLRFPFRTMLRVDKDVESDCLHGFCIRETGVQSRTRLNTAWLLFGKPAYVILVSKAHSDKHFYGATMATEREESLASLPCPLPHRHTQQPFPVPAVIILKFTRTKASYSFIQLCRLKNNSVTQRIPGVRQAAEKVQLWRVKQCRCRGSHITKARECAPEQRVQSGRVFLM